MIGILDVKVEVMILIKHILAYAILMCSVILAVITMVQCSIIGDRRLEYAKMCNINKHKLFCNFKFVDDISY